MFIIRISYRCIIDILSPLKEVRFLAAIGAAGFAILNYNGFLKIIAALIISPILAITVGFLVMSLFKVIFKHVGLNKTNNRLRYFQILTACVQSFTHGTNDAQKAMGIITMALLAGHYQSGDDVQGWVRFACALAMGLGTSIGGYKIIKTVGGCDVMELQENDYDIEKLYFNVSKILEKESELFGGGPKKSKKEKNQKSNK